MNGIGEGGAWMHRMTSDWNEFVYIETAMQADDE